MSNLLICLQTAKGHFQYISKDRSCPGSLTERAVWSACVHDKPSMRLHLQATWPAELRLTTKWHLVETFALTSGPMYREYSYQCMHIKHIF